MSKRACFTCKAPERHVRCHATCERYLAEREQSEAQYERTMMEQAINDVKYDRIMRVKSARPGMNVKQYLGRRTQEE